MRIYTLTLNPAFDVHVYAERFVPYHENIARILSREAGGKGVNISRALRSAHVDSTAVILLGRDNAAEYRRCLAGAGLSLLEIEQPGSIRENLTVHCGNGPETRISFQGFAADDRILEELFARIRPDGDTILTMTGRIGNGMSIGRVKAFLTEASSCGAKIVVDSRSFTLADLAEVKPWLIKPNQEELSAYCGQPVEDMTAALAKAREISRLGMENTLVSLGEQGALLITGEQAFYAAAPQVQAVSTIGAGDSAIAGFLAAAVRGEGPEGRLASAVAFGSAACLTEGTQPPEGATIRQLLPHITVCKI